MFVFRLLQSFFGRSYNNLSITTECKNGGECVINKKNRTACKACRLRKCLMVGMSKSGSRYGRRSNWFKIHCLLQEQQQQQQQQFQSSRSSVPQPRHPISPPGLHATPRKEEAMMLGLDEYKNSSSPSISSPESLNSESSVDISERRAAFVGHPGFRPFHPHHLPPHSVAELSVLSKEMMGLPLGFHLGGMSLLPPTLLPPSSLSMFSPYHLYATHGSPLTMNNSQSVSVPRHSPIESDTTGATIKIGGTSLLESSKDNTCTNNNDRHHDNHNVTVVHGHHQQSPKGDHHDYPKRFYLESVLKRQRSPVRSPAASDKTRSVETSPSTSPLPKQPGSPLQENPMDLSMKTISVTHLSDASDDEGTMKDFSGDERSPPMKRRLIDVTSRF